VAWHDHFSFFFPWLAFFRIIFKYLFLDVFSISTIFLREYKKITMYLIIIYNFSPKFQCIYHNPKFRIRAYYVANSDSTYPVLTLSFSSVTVNDPQSLSYKAASSSLPNPPCIFSISLHYWALPLLPPLCLFVNVVSTFSDGCNYMWPVMPNSHFFMIYAHHLNQNGLSQTNI
jgi:hypothetical protein